MTTNNKILVTDLDANSTLASILKKHLPDQSWAKVKKLIASRQATIGGEVCMDPARRLKANDEVILLAHAAPQKPDQDPLIFRHLDEHLVVVEKPAMVNTVRHPLERKWKDSRKELSPTLEDLVAKKIQLMERHGKGPRPKLRVVQRLDKETSGLVVFARSVEAERGLGRQFHHHTVERKYLALVPGLLLPQTIESTLVRDRGDGRRGSSHDSSNGKKAITHVNIVERLDGFTLMGCQLETGRTHQIRIHLSEKGHPVCGDRVYRNAADGSLLPDGSGFPRVALHAAELGFIHPITGVKMHWSMDPPSDLLNLLNKLRKKNSRG